MTRQESCMTDFGARHSTIRLHFAPGAEVGPCSREAGATADQKSYSASAQSFLGPDIRRFAFISLRERKWDHVHVKLEPLPYRSRPRIVGFP